MLGLHLNHIEICVNTTNGVFSTYIKFEKGLNIIRAENSSGKSTCVNAIAYALGLESILGPRGKRPFPKSMYDTIENNRSDKSIYHVVDSVVHLSMHNNRGEFVKLKRDILGFVDKISIDQNGSVTDYYLKSSGKIGSANTERGFHFWLEKFIGWDLPKVVTFDGNEVKLYLECIFPLFFIEQKRGWSEIQANVPTAWGIKNVRQSAVQFCLNIDNFELNRKIADLVNKISSEKENWENLKEVSKNIADFSSVILKQASDIDDKDGDHQVHFFYKENESLISVISKEISLKKYIKELSKIEPCQLLNDEIYQSAQSSIRLTRDSISQNNISIELCIKSLSDVEEKISILKQDLSQYQQLKRLRDVGSDIGAGLETEICPICDNKLLDTLGNSSVKRKPMTLEENIDFLKNQLDFFSAIKRKNHKKLEELNSASSILNSILVEKETKIRQIKSDLNDIYGEEKNKLRKRIEAESKLEEVVKLNSTQEKINNKMIEIRNSWQLASDTLINIRKSESKINAQKKINALQAKLRENLESFGFSSSPLDSVTISPRTLRPEQEGYDIVAESSASDYIRIIWAYTLALLQLAGNDPDIKHGGFVVFDEPRQQEANKLSFIQLIKKASDAAAYDGQVIFATSLDEAELRNSCINKEVNLWCFDDYVLNLENSVDG